MLLTNEILIVFLWFWAFIFVILHHTAGAI
jgi:hypothetical protein